MVKFLPQRAKRISLIALMSVATWGGKAFAQTYCTPTTGYGSCCSWGIAQVDFVGISNSSNFGSGTVYEDYSNLSTAVEPGTTETIYLDFGQSWDPMDAYVWVDWNNDGTFQSGEGTNLNTYNYTSVSMSISIPSLTASIQTGPKRMRVMAKSSWYGGSNDPCFINWTYGEYEDYTILLASSSGIDIMAYSFSPSTGFTVGSNAFSLKAISMAPDSVESFDIGYKLGAASAVTQSVSSVSAVNSGNKLGLGNSLTTSFSTSLSIPSAGFYTLKVWARNANGGSPADNYPSNDTITRTICTAMNGTYTIGSTGNFTSFTAAADALRNCGVSGPVTFTVQSGTYTEQVVIGSIPGSSATNTITFDGVDTATRKLTFDASSSSKHTLQLNDARYITFKNLYIEGTDYSYAYAVNLAGNSDYNTFRNCVITTTSTGTYYYDVIPVALNGLNYYDASRSDYNKFVSCRIRGGGMSAINLYGDYNSPMYQNRFDSCIISNAFYYGIYTYYAGENIITNNTFNNLGTSGSMQINIGYYGDNSEIINNTIYGYNRSTGIYLNYASSTKIMQNKIEAGNYGIQLYYASACEIVNNIANASGTGVYLDYGSSNNDFFHNTVIASGTQALFLFYATWGSASANNFVNNIFRNVGSGYAVYSQNTSCISTFDYNVLNAGGSNFAFNGALFSSLSAWKSADPTLNQRSFASAPVFVSGSDFHLSASVMPMTGDNTLGYSTDIDGESRCAIAPSIGADESKYVWPTPTPGILATYPNTAVTGYDTVWINSPYDLTNVYPVNAAVNNVWDVHNDGNNDGTGAVLSYTFTNPGWDSVKITTTNCSGSASIVRYVYVDTPAMAPTAEFIADKYAIDNGEVSNLVDLSENGPTTWSWSVYPTNGVSIYPSSTDKNVEITFNDGGTYEICLTVTNARGSTTLCKPAYIKVNATAYTCSFPINTKASEGSLYDEGGPVSNYNDPWNYNNFINNIGSYCNFLIEPCADTVNFVFSSLSLQPTYTGYGSGFAGDSVQVFDGTTPDYSRLLGSYGAGSTAWINKVHVAPSGNMLIRFRKNNDGGYQGTGAGFSGNWTSVAGTFPAPVLTLDAPSVGYVGLPVYVKVHSNSPTGNIYDADLDGDPTYIEFEDVTDSVFDNYYSMPGTYEIMVRMENCGGVDTVKQLISIVYPSSLPFVDFESDLTTATQNDTITLTEMTDFGVWDWRWEITPATYTPVAGNETSPVFRFVLNNIGTYSVKLIAENDFGVDSLTKTSYIEVIDYCTPDANNLNSDIGISKVTLPASSDGINKSSDQGKSGYNDFTNTGAATLEIGQSYTVTVERNTPALNDMNRKVWIDWNLDGDFDATELVGSESAAQTASFSQTFSIPSTATPGSTRMRVGVSFKNQANDPCGPNNFGEFEDYRIYIKQDKTKPVITVLGNNPDTTEEGFTYTDPGATAMDNIDGNLDDSIKVVSTVSTAAPGTYTITYNVQDSKGNAAVTKVRTVVVRADKTAPVITKIGNDTIVEVGSTYTDLGATAYDMKDGNVTPFIISVNSVNTALLGTYQVSYDVTDAAGNVATTVVRNVIVADRTAPVLTLNGNAVETLEVNTPYTDAGVTVTDNYYGTAQINVTSTPFNNDSVGVFVITYNAEDASANTATPVTRTIVVMDRTAPVVVLTGDSIIIVEVHGAYNDPGETVTDNYCEGLTAVKAGSVNTSVLGDYVITYDVTDCEGNVATTVKRTIRVVDTKRPVITLNGLPGVTIQRWDPFVDPGVTIADNYYTDAQLQPLLVVGGNLDTLLPGLYVVSYNVTDPSGNAAVEVFRQVLVVDRYLGIDNNTDVAADIQVYPNPTTGMVNIVSGLAEEVQISVVNTFGQTIVNGVQLTNGKVQVDLSGFAAGMYMIRLDVAGQTITKQINLVK